MKLVSTTFLLEGNRNSARITHVPSERADCSIIPDNSITLNELEHTRSTRELHSINLLTIALGEGKREQYFSIQDWNF